MMDILKKPLITEKLSALGEKLNRYGFKVESKANKIESARIRHYRTSVVRSLTSSCTVTRNCIRPTA